MWLKDERLESFCWQLLSMEFEFRKMKLDFEELNKKLVMIVEEKSRVERVVEVKDKELCVLLNIMLQNGEGLFIFDVMDLDQFSYYDV